MIGPNHKYRPDISPAVENDILELLLPLLRPIGDDRRTHAVRSKGRGRRKKHKVQQDIGPTQLAEELPRGPPSLTIGFNSTFRNLESLARLRQTEKDDDQNARTLKTTVVFACPSSMAHPTLHSLPLLVATASLADEKSEPIRLVEISAQGEAAISHALALPRVNVLAVGESLLGSQALAQYARTAVKPIEVHWLKEACSSTYLPLKLETVTVPVGVKGSRKRKASGSGVE